MTGHLKPLWRRHSRRIADSQADFQTDCADELAALRGVIAIPGRAEAEAVRIQFGPRSPVGVVGFVD